MSQQLPDPIPPPGGPVPGLPPVQEPRPDGRDAPVEIPPDDDIVPPVPERV